MSFRDGNGIWAFFFGWDNKWRHIFPLFFPVDLERLFFFFFGKEIWDRLGKKDKWVSLGFCLVLHIDFFFSSCTPPLFFLFSQTRAWNDPSREQWVGILIFNGQASASFTFLFSVLGTKYHVHLILIFPFFYRPDIIPHHGRVLGWTQVIDDTPWFFSHTAYSITVTTTLFPLYLVGGKCVN
ncbi:hypothetical protein V8F20_004303 [Naviculisporaceae sp. PSN 640]